MRRVIVIAAAIVGAVVIFAGAILFYAATNLNSIIAERRQNILDKVSIALGRQVHADDIKVTLGWGIMADVTGVQVADDPDISKKPFIEASNVYTPSATDAAAVAADRSHRSCARQAGDQNRPDSRRHLQRLDARPEKGPDRRGIAARRGRRRGRREPSESPMAEAGRAPSTLGSLLVQNFSINDGTLTYETEGAPEGASVNAIDLKLRDFGFDAQFTIDAYLRRARAISITSIFRRRLAR